MPAILGDVSGIQFFKNNNVTITFLAHFKVAILEKRNVSFLRIKYFFRVEFFYRICLHFGSIYTYENDWERWEVLKATRDLTFEYQTWLVFKTYLVDVLNIL